MSKYIRIGNQMVNIAYLIKYKIPIEKYIEKSNEVIFINSGFSISNNTSRISCYGSKGK